uniref:Uncharacterized protein n=1 Tax=Cannabis sativa TaxID=3483 RepID=A0A803R357_CANSA
MANTIESSLLKLFFNALSSPTLQKIAQLWDLKNDVAELQRCLATASEEEEEEEDYDFNGELRLIKAYEAEDMLHSLTIIAGKLIDDSGTNRRPIS